MWTWPELSSCGWAFSSVTRPWVAQRVWAMPVVDGGSGAGAVVGARLDRGAQVGEVADRVDALDLAVREHGEAGRVIAPVFELFQPREQQLLAGPRAHVSDDAAHEGE